MPYRRELLHDCDCLAQPFKLKSVKLEPEVLNASIINPITDSGLSQVLRALLEPEAEFASPSLLK